MNGKQQNLTTQKVILNKKKLSKMIIYYLKYILKLKNLFLTVYV